MRKVKYDAVKFDGLKLNWIMFFWGDSDIVFLAVFAVHAPKVSLTSTVLIVCIANLIDYFPKGTLLSMKRLGRADHRAFLWAHI